MLARVMSYEYLWHHIREVGGAYGTGMVTRAETEYLYTYRDPHLAESYETFAKGPAELAACAYTEKDLTDSIVGTQRRGTSTAGTSAASPTRCWPQTARPCAA